VIGCLPGRGDREIVPVEQYCGVAHALADRFLVLKCGAVALSGSKAGMPQAGLRAAVSV
jgi:urea transport system ATP-binding protein